LKQSLSNVTTRDPGNDVTESPGITSPGVGNFHGGTERSVRVQLTDTHETVAATVWRGVARVRAPANEQ